VSVFFFGPIFLLTTHAFPLHITRSKQDKATLKDWCRGFGLHHSGNKTALKNELRVFSRNQTAWDRYVLMPFFHSSLFLSLYLKFIHTLFGSLLPGARRTHRGPRIGSKKKVSKKASTHLAANNLFPSQRAAIPHAPATLPTQAAQLAASQVVDDEADLNWVSTSKYDFILLANG
jgi:hypothetical protein